MTQRPTAAFYDMDGTLIKNFFALTAKSQRIVAGLDERSGMSSADDRAHIDEHFTVGRPWLSPLLMCE
ncbi:MAG: hypothetical protein AAGI01_15760 [Myxococcota bacterium]